MELELVTRSDLNENEDFLSGYIVKINKPGVAYCFCCNIDIVYGSSGKEIFVNMLKEMKNMPKA